MSFTFDPSLLSACFKKNLQLLLMFTASRGLWPHFLVHGHTSLFMATPFGSRPHLLVHGHTSLTSFPILAELDLVQSPAMRPNRVAWSQGHQPKKGTLSGLGVPSCPSKLRSRTVFKRLCPLPGGGSVKSGPEPRSLRIRHCTGSECAVQ